MQLALNLTGGYHDGPLFVIVKQRGKKHPERCGWDRREKQERRACPPWMPWKIMQELKREVYRMSKRDGVLYSLDHIVPLENPIVCGLHVPWNTEVLTLEKNVRKSNNVWPDMPLQQLELIK